MGGLRRCKGWKCISFGALHLEKKEYRIQENIQINCVAFQTLLFNLLTAEIMTADGIEE